MKTADWNEITDAMTQFNIDRGYTTKGTKNKLTGVVVFTEDSFTEIYSEKTAKL